MGKNQSWRSERSERWNAPVAVGDQVGRDRRSSRETVARARATLILASLPRMASAICVQENTRHVKKCELTREVRMKGSPIPILSVFQTYVDIRLKMELLY